MSDPTPVCPVCQKPSVPDAPQGLCPKCLIKTGFESRSENEPAKSFVAPSIEEMAALFPQLEIIELLGQGGMGAVYKARQLRLDRFVAFKILARERQDDPQFAERFEREARALAALTHPHIVTVYDFGEAGEHYYLLMEFVDGSNLRQLYRTGQVSPARALAIIPQICDALQYAHERGIVHRDIKPENIMLDKTGVVKIADFGLAKILDLDPKNLSLTAVNQVVGTPHYMAPEQLEKPLTVDCRADIYSVGVVFYEMLTGELPLGKFPLPSQKVSVDARIDHVVMQALEKEPALRYQNVGEVKTAVESIATASPAKLTMPVKTPPIKSPPVQLGMSGTAKAVIAVSCVAFVLFLACAAIFLTSLAKKPIVQSRVVATTSSDALNDDQRAVIKHTDEKFHTLLEHRDFSGWSPQRLADLENASLNIVNNPPPPNSRNRNDYFRAISTLGALRSVKAVPALINIVSARTDKLVWTEKANRDRWMATRALGTIGNKGAIPQLIPLLYHPSINTRWWAQVALVQVTGQNFGGDWNAWAKWWNSQNLPPPIGAELVRWWGGQETDPAKLTSMMTDLNRQFFDGLGGSMTGGKTNTTNDL